MSYQVTSLPNGLRVASEVQPELLSAAFAIGVDVGARHESLAEGGLSHLLEHMAFKGTSKLNARNIAEAFDLMGGNVNAYTSHEHTVYYVKVLKEYADDALQLLCAIVTDFAFEQSELEREREVVLQEIAMHHDSPDDLVFDVFQEAAFGEQPLGRSILGTRERVRSFSRDDLIGYTSKHYRPTRMVVVGAGAVSHARTAEIAAEYFGDLVGGDDGWKASAAHYSGGERLIEKDLEQVQLVVGYPAVAISHADYFPLQMLATVLGGGMSSRLFQEIREKRGLAYSVSAFATGYNDTGVLGFYAGTTVDHLPELTGALKDVVGEALEHITEAELVRARNQLKAGVVMTKENCGAVSEWIARHLMVYGRYKTAEEILGMLDAVTIEQMQRAGRSCLSAIHPCVAALGPEGSVKDAGLLAQFAA